MIKTGKEFVAAYEAAFRAEGGDPEACEAFVWARDTVNGSTNLTFRKLIDKYGAKLSDGTAHHGWGIGVLSVLWNSISASDRLRILDLIKGCGLKFLLSEKFAKSKLTDGEKALATSVFTAGRCEAAVRRLNG